MAGLFNPVSLVYAHLKTLRKLDGRSGLPAKIFFLVGPAGVAALLAWASITLTEGIVDILITSMSIFAALLFNLLLLVYDIIHKQSSESSTRGLPGDPVGFESEEKQNQRLRQTLLAEVFSNISFAVLVSVFVVVLLLAWIIVPPLQAGRTSIAIAGGVYYLTIVFLLTLLMVLKRVHILLTREVSL